MSYDYSENILVQGAAGDLLHDELGWDWVYAHNQKSTRRLWELELKWVVPVGCPERWFLI